MARIYPSTTIPALAGSNVPLARVLEVWDRIRASLKPEEIAGALVNDMDVVKVDFTPAPTAKEALEQTRALAQANVVTGLTPQQTADIVALLANVRL